MGYLISSKSCRSRRYKQYRAGRAQHCNRPTEEVSEQYSQTLNNEKKISKQISQLLAEEILKELGKRLNDI